MTDPGKYVSICDMLRDCGWTENQDAGCFERGTDKIPFADIGYYTPKTFAAANPLAVTPAPVVPAAAAPNSSNDLAGAVAGGLGSLGYWV